MKLYIVSQKLLEDISELLRALPFDPRPNSAWHLVGEINNAVSVSNEQAGGAGLRICSSCRRPIIRSCSCDDAETERASAAPEGCKCGSWEFYVGRDGRTCSLCGSPVEESNV